MKLFSIVVMMISLALPIKTLANDTVDQLLSVSVTVLTPRGSGSGTIFTRKRDNDTISFIWTAAHVVSDLRYTKNVIDGKSGTQKVLVNFDDAKIAKTLLSEGREIGRTELMAQVIRYSHDEDLALLRIRQKNFIGATTTFYLDDKIPPLSTPLIHIGSLLGESGSNSVSNGIISQHGRLIEGKVFDQTTVIAYPGSSGGGVFLTSGAYVGMICRGSGVGYNFMAPVRRIKVWAKDAGVAFAIDMNIPLPNDDELKKLPIEDNGVTFSYLEKLMPKPANNLFNFKKD